MRESQAATAALQQHARFFDQLVDLIPAKYYHNDSSDRVDLHAMKKAARQAMKQEFKAKAKENKRSKLDPDAPGTTLEIQQQQLAAKQEEEAAAAAAAAAGGAARQLNLAPAGASLSREELKAKLQRKIEAIQQQRNAKEKQAVAQQAKEWRQKTLENSAKQKQRGQGEQQKQAAQAGSKRQAVEPAGDEQQQHPAKRQAKQQQQQQSQAAGKQATDSDGQTDNEFQFARLDFGDNKSHGPGGRHKKATKEQLLKAAEAKQAALAAATATEDGKVLAVQEAWQTALARAEGAKVLDDPKLLRRSLKKEAKRKAKSAAAWQERKQAQQDQQDRKQQRRSDNLQARVDKKLQTKKEKREKKLLRAGFEGRKAGFIGDKAPTAAAPAAKQ